MDQKLHPSEGMATTSSDSSPEQPQQQQSEVVQGQNTTCMSQASPDPPEQQQYVVEGELERVDRGYYIEGVRLDENGARARCSVKQGPSQLPPDCKEACDNFKLIINSFCPSQEFPIRRLYHTETVFDALYADESKDIFPPKRLPKFKSNPTQLLKQIEEVPSSAFTWYHLPANNVYYLHSKKIRLS
jgi:hypothetical protein